MDLWAETMGTSVRFEFGDRRWTRGQRHLVVEHDTAGGVTNWAKHLAFVAHTPDVEIRVLHLYQHAADREDATTHYQSHRRLQEWLRDLAAPVTGDRFRGEIVLWPSDRDRALALFTEMMEWLQRDTDTLRMRG
jgi:hypothetical protein